MLDMMQYKYSVRYPSAVAKSATGPEHVVVAPSTPVKTGLKVWLEDNRIDHGESRVEPSEFVTVARQPWPVARTAFHHRLASSLTACMVTVIADWSSLPVQFSFSL